MPSCLISMLSCMRVPRVRDGAIRRQQGLQRVLLLLLLLLLLLWGV